MLLRELGSTAQPSPALGRCVESLVRAGAEAWPEVSLPVDVFIRHLADVLDAEVDPLDALQAIRGDELHLACACAQGNEAALRAFDRVLMPEAKAMLERVVGPADADDVAQRVRERLLLAHDDAPPRIATYAGRGRLVNWVRISARRLALNLVPKAAAASASPNVLLELADGVAEPELVVLERAYAAGFKQAFEAAFEALTARQRTLLRLRYVDGLEVNQIATTLQRHRVNISRALTRARADLLEHLRRALVDSLSLRESEVDSVMRLMRSQVDLSLGRLLGPGSG